MDEIKRVTSLVISNHHKDRQDVLRKQKQPKNILSKKECIKSSIGKNSIDIITNRDHMKEEGKKKERSSSAASNKLCEALKSISVEGKEKLSEESFY